MLNYVKNYLLPLFPGTAVRDEAQKKPKSSNKPVSLLSPTKIALLFDRTDITRIVLARSQPFDNDEIKLIENFIVEMNKIKSADFENIYKEELITIALKLCIAKFLNEANYKTIAKIIDIFEELSSRTYEGTNLSLGLGLTNSQSNSNISIDDLYDNDFGLVLSNGYNTIIKANFSGLVLGQEHLVDLENNSFSPVTYIPVANWSEDDKISFVLNRNGEILIFSKKKLLFSRRRRKWQFYSHDVLIKRLAAEKKSSWSEKLRRAVFESSLDASFARSGGILSLVMASNEKEIENYQKYSDLPGKGDSTKSRFIFNAINTNFIDIPRRLRQELTSIDGALIIDHLGNILNVGSIITKIDPSSDGGARTAAARSLAKLGVALKISMDGQIFGYAKGNEMEDVYKYLTYG